MSERIALIGFVNTEEIIADKIKTQTPDVQVDGYELFPNEAFGRVVDERYPLYGVNDGGEFGLHNLSKLSQLRSIGYAAVNLGPIPAALILEDILKKEGAEYVGPRRNELEYELDKTRITDIFPESSGVLPTTRILDNAQPERIRTAIKDLDGKVVFKFVGEYSKYYQDSETRRVRMMEEFKSREELHQFITNSVDASGKVVLQNRVDGQQFSYTVLVDGNEGMFRLGENICYKHRYDGETGPLGDGTGSISIDNTLPNLVTADDIKFIEDKIVRPYVGYLGNTLGRDPKTFLNLDLIKDSSGRVYLLEVNNREPGGHTMASLLAGLKTPLVDVLEATQTGRLREITPSFETGASVVVSAYPENFPYPFESEEHRPRLVIPKLKRADSVKIYTGWVDVEEDLEDSVVALAKLSPTMLFNNYAPTIKEATKSVYARMREVVPAGFDYRKDIGIQ